MAVLLPLRRCVLVLFVMSTLAEIVAATEWEGKDSVFEKEVLDVLGTFVAYRCVLRCVLARVHSQVRQMA